MLKCPECGERILHDSKVKVWIGTRDHGFKWFCSRTCANKYTDRENKRRERQLKEAKRKREQQHLEKWFEKIEREWFECHP
jgi:hypothetical protein